VHKILPFQNKHILKDLIKFVKFRYARGVVVPYWVTNSSSRGIFQGEATLVHVVNVRWMGVRLLGMGFNEILGLLLSHLWVPL
jgi:hypothetical protein